MLKLYFDNHILHLNMTLIDFMTQPVSKMGFINIHDSYAINVRNINYIVDLDHKHDDD